MSSVRIPLVSQQRLHLVLGHKSLHGFLLSMPAFRGVPYSVQT
jgi:hypothetical protein